MNPVTLDADTATKLSCLNQPVDLVDPSGRILGQFIPQFDLSEWEPLTPDITEEELDRRAQSTQWYTTEEVIAHLKKQEQP
jgi:hypothetical protein